ncbi:MAG: tRNA (adenosine(37)-N6)-threonylcarbamoyltransferase complex dimerization subunit type 1 TsaB [Gammaproteobacteria bacterium]|nr:tRNA (adenosine(37)-N6)-threonylcarbamoyltransferase complex dimerization subunit type 1 TsaB [Gammaproteobacteria bacterium]
MKVLALESATDACSVALFVEGEILQRYALAPQRHTQLMLPMVSELCAVAGLGLGTLDAIAVGVGPGAFAGVRIASALAQGLALAHGLPVAPISTLAALALGGARLHGERVWLVALDARRQELYWAHYAVDPALTSATLLRAEQVGPPAAVVAPPTARWGIAGTGAAIYRAHRAADAPAGEWGDPQWPQAQDVARLGATAVRQGQLQAPDLLVPVYLRPAV